MTDTPRPPTPHSRRGSFWHSLLARGGSPERVRHVFVMAKLAALCSLSTALVMVATAWDHVPRPALVGWASAIVIHGGWMLLSHLKAPHLRITRISNRTLWRMSFFSISSALIWTTAPIGALIWLDGPALVQALVVFVAFAVCAAVLYSVIPLLSAILLTGMFVPCLVVALIFDTGLPLLGVVALTVLFVFLLIASLEFSAYVSAAERQIRAREETLSLLEDAHHDISRLANTDPVTDIHNRRAFLDQLERIGTLLPDLATRGNYALYLIDLDNFKHTNDAFGHEIGDRYLRHVAQQLTNEIPDCMVARVGGDEFAVLSHTPLSKTRITAIGTTIRDLLTAGVKIDDVHVKGGATIAAALAPAHTRTIETWLSYADHRLLVAKSKSRGHFRLFTDDDRIAMEARKAQGRALDRAIKNGEIKPFYQPQVNISTGHLIGFEVLARWTQPDGTSIAPTVFFDLAQERGRVLDITDALYLQVAQDLAAWRKAGLLPDRIAVNIHPDQLNHIDNLRRQVWVLTNALGGADRLVLEVTENCIIGRGQETAPELLHMIARTGCQISLDDFGTGYASLTHIRDLPIHELKIDRSFIAGIERSKADRGIVQAVLDIARARGVMAVVEGIENEAQRDTLRILGCRFGQGFFYSKPIDSAAALAFLQQASRDVI